MGRAEIPPYEDDPSIGKALINDTERREMQIRDLTRRATTDSLTGVLNRRAFEEYLDQMFEQFRANKEHNKEKVLAVFALDIDHFKSINDTFGHPTGDAVLKEFATLLQEYVRDTDRVGRVGGEEFAIVIETTKGRSYDRAEEIRKRIEDSMVLPDGRKVTVSIGIASTMGHLKDRDRLLTLADVALYEAKQGGRNQTREAGNLSIDRVAA